ncbi:hypothetical protein GGX14DRAFT_454159 [Mycena pura]|uniref:DUF6534 domain-containing protein n=1 Tax=Mycena pura TaxID=153505 RepID=A0AAD6YBZ3_9AGAR|nr:hypothetical protein GGX14DRAFT_454159 [Mycena pura]
MEHLNLNPTLGAYQIGVLLSSVLFGVLSSQTYVYFTRFPNDLMKTKTLVGFMWICEAGHEICIAASLYGYTITGYGDPETLLRMPSTFVVAVLLHGIISGAVQGFFAFRIYALSKTLYVPCVCWMLGLLRLVGTAMVLGTGLRGTLANYLVQWEWLLTVLWISGVVNDTMIAATLAFILYRERNNAFTRMIPLVNKLIRWTIETGIVTSTATCLILICYFAMRTNYIFLAVFVVSSRLYSNSLLASLNSRATLRKMDEVQLSSPIVTLDFPRTRNSEFQAPQATSAAYGLDSV